MRRIRWQLTSGGRWRIRQEAQELRSSGCEMHSPFQVSTSKPYYYGRMRSCGGERWSKTQGVCQSGRYRSDLFRQGSPMTDPCCCRGGRGAERVGGLVAPLPPVPRAGCRMQHAPVGRVPRSMARSDYGRAAGSMALTRVSPRRGNASDLRSVRLGVHKPEDHVILVVAQSGFSMCIVI